MHRFITHSNPARSTFLSVRSPTILMVNSVHLGRGYYYNTEICNERTFWVKVPLSSCNQVNFGSKHKYLSMRRENKEPTKLKLLR